MKLIKALKIGSIFMLGLIVGVVLMNLLHMYVRPVFIRILQTEFEVEQEYLATRAIRNNDNLRAVLHRWNVADTSSLQVFRGDKYKNNTLSSFFFPFYLLPLKMSGSEAISLEKGEQIVEGINRGKLAVALESINQKDEAGREWDKAKSLTKRKSIEETKELVFRLLQQDNSPVHLEVERAILNDKEKAQHKNRGDRE